jgi:hypothetical protein
MMLSVLVAIFSVEFAASQDAARDHFASQSGPATQMIGSGGAIGGGCDKVHAHISPPAANTAVMRMIVPLR